MTKKQERQYNEHGQVPFIAEDFGAAVRMREDGQIATGVLIIKPPP